MCSQLSNAEKERYKRNLLMPEIGEQGQQKIKAARVLVVGAGGIGSPVIAYLAAAGVGQLGIIDGDKIELSNLQRQFLHRTTDVGMSKAQSAARFVEELNPNVKVNIYEANLTDDNAEAIIANYDFVVAATDNFQSRKLINRVCVKRQKPFSLGAISGMQAQAMTYVPGSACYCCLFGDEQVDKKIPAGVLGAAVGLLGTIQAIEVIKYFIGGELLINEVLLIDVMSMSFQKIAVERNSKCKICCKK